MPARPLVFTCRSELARMLFTARPEASEQARIYKFKASRPGPLLHCECMT